MSTWIKIKGTQTGEFQLGFTGPVLKNSSGNLQLRNSANTAFVDVSAGNVTASGNISGQYILGDGSFLTGIGTSNVAVTVSGNAQPNITSLGTLTSLSVSGNANVGTLFTDNIKYANGESYQFTTNAAGSNTQVQFNNNNAFGASSAFTFNTATNTLSVTNISANGAQLTNINGANVTGTVANATYATSAGSADSATTAGTVTTASQPNITSVGTLTSLSVSGNAAIGNVSSTGLISTSGNVSGQYIFGDGSFLTGIGTSNTAVTVSGNAQPNITSVGTLTSLQVSGDATITGNLTVSGNTTYINVETFQVQDPIIELGGGANGAPLTTNDGKDRGTLLHYYTTAPVDAFMGWDNSNGEFAFGSNVSITNDVVTYNAFGNVRAATFIGDLSGTATFAGTANSVAGANVSGTVGSATTAGTVTANAQSNITSLGTLTSLTVDGITNLGSVANVKIGGGSANYVLSTDGTGNLSWQDSAAVTGVMRTDSTSFAFGSSSTISAFTLPANAIVDTVSIIVDIAFNGGAPTITVGVNGGSATEYAEATDSDLSAVGRYDVPSAVIPAGSPKNIELYFSGSGSSIGEGRVVISYSIPA